MSSTILITRRRQLALLAGASILGPIAAARGQTAGVLLRLAPRLLGVGLLGWGLYELFKSDGSKAATPDAAAAKAEAERAEASRQAAEREAAQRAAEKPYADRLASFLGADPAWAQEVVHTYGPELTQKITDGKMAVWAQRDRTGLQVNRFDVVIQNNSPEAVAGGMRIAIADLTSGKREFDYRYRGYRVDPFKTLRYTVPFEAPFPQAGIKRIALLDQPAEVQAEPVDLLVAPLETLPSHLLAQRKAKGRA